MYVWGVGKDRVGVVFCALRVYYIKGVIAFVFLYDDEILVVGDLSGRIVMWYGFVCVVCKL